MRFDKQFLFLIVLTVTACTKGQPILSVLDQNVVPQPRFQGQTSVTLATDSTVATLAVSGTCDPRIERLLAQPIGPVSAAADLAQFATGAPTVTCATDGKFSFTLNSLQTLGFRVVENGTYEVQLRAVTTGGTSNPSHVYVHYSSPNANAPPRTLITSGSSLGGGDLRRASSSHFQAQVRIDHLSFVTPSTAPDTLPVSTSAHFQAKIGASVSAD